MIDLSSLKSIYNSTIDDLISSNGLSVPCLFVFSDNNQTQCPNCNFNPIANRSSNIYNGTGPIYFPEGQICPICNGKGAVYNSTEETINLVIIFDYKKFINFGNVSVPNGSMQSICGVNQYTKLKTVDHIIVDTNITNYAQNKFTRISEPQPVGLGNNRYIFTNWERSA